MVGYVLTVMSTFMRMTIPSEMFYIVSKTWQLADSLGQMTTVTALALSFKACKGNPPVLLKQVQDFALRWECGRQYRASICSK